MMRAEAAETGGDVAERFRIQKAPETGSKDHISKPKKQTAGRRHQVHLVHLSHFTGEETEASKLSQ